MPVQRTLQISGSALAASPVLGSQPPCGIVAMCVGRAGMLPVCVFEVGVYSASQLIAGCAGSGSTAATF
jgi:hypothetical protein